MATFKVLLETRRPLQDGTYSLVIRIYNERKFRTVSLNIRLKEDEFDIKSQRAVKHPNRKEINQKIVQTLIQLLDATFKFELSDELTTAQKIKTAAFKPKLRLILRSHLEEPVSIGDLASKFGMGTRTLSRLFMQDLGMSYIQFLKILRMITAFELLVENKHTIREIAFKVGYSSVPTFSNVFYQSTGIRPTQYLNNRK